MYKGWGIAIVLCLFILLRWNSFELPLERDEGEYFYAAKMLSHGLPIYKNAFIQKPPGTFYIYWIASQFKNDIIALRLISLLSIFISMIIVGQTLKIRFPNASEYLVLTISLGFFCIPIPYLWVHTANTEIFLLVPISILLMFAAKQKPYHLISGVTAAIALCIKPTALFLVLSFFVYDQYKLFKNGFSIKHALVASTKYLIAGSLTTFLIMLPTLYRNDLPYFYESVIHFNWLYKEAFSQSAWWANLSFFMRIFWLPIILAIIGIILDIRKHFYIILAGTACALSISSGQIPRYYVILFPLGIYAVGICFSKLFHSKSTQLIFAIALVIFLVFPYKSHFFESTAQLNQFLYPNQCNMEVYELAQELKEDIRVGDSLYIAGSEPQIHHYLKTFNYGRFITKYPLMLNTKHNLDYQNEEIQILKEFQPKEIILCTFPESWLGSNTTPDKYLSTLNQYMKTQELSTGFKNECLTHFRSN